MREELVKVFSFEELNEVAKEVARNWWRRGGVDCSDEIIDSIGYELDTVGLPKDDLEFSLSYSKGDGVAFYGQWEDLEDNLEEHGWIEKLSSESRDAIRFIIGNDYYLEANIERNSYGHHYSHWNTMDITVESDDLDLITEEYIGMGSLEQTSVDEYAEYYNMFEEAIEELERVLTEVVREVSTKAEEIGYEIIEYYDSDEYIDEVLDGNEYEFTEDGERWV